MYKIPLKEKLNLELIQDGITLEIDEDFMKNFVNEDFIGRNATKSKYIPNPVSYLYEEDDSKSPFEILAASMSDVTLDGKIKKSILRNGVGETPSEGSYVSILYFTYLEYSDEPTDSRFADKQFRFQLGYTGLPGLTLAVQSMKMNERSLFLIGHEYAYGKLGHPPRVPSEATILFQIELVAHSDTPLLQDIRRSDRYGNSFAEAKQIASGLMENAKNLFKRNNPMAIAEYRKAVSIMEECHLRDMEEQDKQTQLLLKLYSNLAVCYTKDGNPKKACSMCNNIYALTKNTSVAIPSKVYFHNGRAHMMLGNYRLAERFLLKALSMQPRDPVILNELDTLRTHIGNSSS